MKKLPIEFQKINKQFVKWQDRHANLFGKLLLMEGLKKVVLESDLNKIKYTKYNRPYIDDSIDFNISHSGEYVVCAIGKNVRLGIDVEKIAEVDFNDFQGVMTPEEWEIIHVSEDSKRSFFNYWSIKESMIKADGRGVSIPLQEIRIEDNQVSYKNKRWHQFNFQMDEAYSSCLTVNIPEIKIVTNYIDFSNKNRITK
ncbi:4'-phosphopantetheinyl transferase family protein [Aquimarina pacifica]|uniref:4'-phosphopantetheinyl transferase family protein n=1 Tax=Aquimarina pacifica TaxID=1296415 RepID=UPI00126952DC|nr:4'-phosphopantetheinyl transferase superfamily protein [Aquimarina pacifica]